MSLEERYESFRKLAGSVVNLALIPLRLPGVVFRFLDEKLVRYEQRRAWKRNVEGTWLDPETREPWWTRIGKGLINDPTQYH